MTHYASLCCSSVIAGTLRALEKGFHRLMNNHTPETESPKFRGELSSILRTTSGNCNQCCRNFRRGKLHSPTPHLKL